MIIIIIIIITMIIIRCCKDHLVQYDELARRLE